MIMAFKTEIDGKEYYALTQEELDAIHDACVTQTAMIQKLEGQLIDYCGKVTNLSAQFVSQARSAREVCRQEVTSDWVKVFCSLH